MKALERPVCILTETSASEDILREAVRLRGDINSFVRECRGHLAPRHPAVSLEQAERARAMIESAYRTRDSLSDRHARLIGARRDITLVLMDSMIDDFNGELDRIFRPTIRALKRLEDEHGAIVFPSVRMMTPRRAVPA